ncbi:LmbE family protein [Russula earlei]|uniref:LmbE family protein n=1 Tax=Russula earlei TaxID=71964 RepID=A0ACC0TRR7_9AGAM|nr:LmbE family protein [Russula earlei]
MKVVITGVVSFLVFILHSSLFAQLPATNTSADIYLQLQKLNVLGSVLYIAAHPDDENNALLPYLAKEKQYRTGYLSLTRGDGGQNLLGSEQGVELGMIRTQELLAARRIDGAEQFFSRAYEFGFSKNSAEALRTWDKEKILSDVVWVIRQFQPDVIITRFPTDARAGHGHHSASAILANEAFKAAADPAKFPEQFNYGVKPWQAKRILWNTFNFGNANTTSEDQLKIDIGGFNPLLGKSYGEIGGEARSMHKSQGEGRPRRKGQVLEYFTTTGGDTPHTSLMDHIAIDWKRLPGGEKVQQMINTVIDHFNIQQPVLSVPALVKIYEAIEALPAGNWRNKKLQEVQDIIEACAGLSVEAITQQPFAVQGGNLAISFAVNDRSDLHPILTHIVLQSSTSARQQELMAVKQHDKVFWLPAQLDTTVQYVLDNNKNVSLNYSFTLSDREPVSQPYWLQYPKTEGMFDVRDQLLIGKAENDPAFTAIFSIQIAGKQFAVKRPIQYKYTDPAKGELYQPLAILPGIELNYMSDNFISLNNSPAKAEIHIKSNIADTATYRVQQQFSANWSSDQKAFDYSVKQSRDAYVSGSFNPLSKENNVKEEIGVTARKGNLLYDSYTKTIAYDHIPTITYFPRAKANLVKLDIQIIGKRIGYIAGAGDMIPQALTQMGYEVVLLTDKDITAANLQAFDAIVTGVRAYNMYDYLTAKYEVLIHYVQNGGNLIVQYNRNNQTTSGRAKIGPYAFTINSGSRVTEENATVHFLLPDHPALNYPNKITVRDFEGWVQERSTYQAEQADSHYEALLGMNDTGEKESNGSLLIAKYGKGNFVYASLVFFRQLPAGVPGAYRLMANLIALPKNN